MANCNEFLVKPFYRTQFKFSKVAEEFKVKVHANCYNKPKLWPYLCQVQVSHYNVYNGLNELVNWLTVFTLDSHGVGSLYLFCPVLMLLCLSLLLICLSLGEVLLTNIKLKTNSCCTQDSYLCKNYTKAWFFFISTGKI